MDNKEQQNFRAIDKTIQVTIPDNREESRRDGQYVNWGTDNIFPNYVHTLGAEVATLSSVLQGCVDFICGDEVRCAKTLQGEYMNLKKDTIEDIVRAMAEDLVGIGGTAVQVINNKAHNGLAEIYAKPVRYFRTDADNERFVYSEKWDEKFSRKSQNVIYPKWIGGYEQDVAIAWAKFRGRNSAYPVPVYAAAIKDCEIERQITEFHLSAIDNGFASPVFINFANGAGLSSDQKDQIERSIREKFCGPRNANRVNLNFSDGVQNRMTVETIDIADFGTKYEALAERSKAQIFSAFRCSPVLFGLPSQNSGFNNTAEEYAASFKLFNRTVIRPMQKMITDTLNKILGGDYVSIAPFSIETLGGQE